MAIPIITVVGTSDSGKTTLIEKLISQLVSNGFRVGSVKHDVHGFEMDREGKDSWRHKHAGASTTIISSPRQIGMVKDVDHEFSLKEIGDRFFDGMDIIMAEGYKRQKYPKVEVHRKIQNRGLLSSAEEGLIAVATDEDLNIDVPCFDLDDARSIALFIINNFNLK